MSKKEKHNYYETFIRVAEDSSAETAQIPQPFRGKKTVAQIQYELIADNPYQMKQADILFETFMRHKNISEAERTEQEMQFFSKEHACLRASPLTKQYGWGAHFDEEGRVALVAVDSAEYQTFANNPDIKQLNAMRSKRKK